MSHSRCIVESAPRQQVHRVTPLSASILGPRASKWRAEVARPGLPGTVPEGLSGLKPALIAYTKMADIGPRATETNSCPAAPARTFRWPVAAALK